MLVRAILLPAVLLASFHLVSSQDGGEKFYEGEFYGVKGAPEKAFKEKSEPQTIDEAIAWAAKDASRRSTFDASLGRYMKTDGMDMVVTDDQYNRLHSGAPRRHERQVMVKPRIHRILVKQIVPDVTPCIDRDEHCVLRADRGDCKVFVGSMRSYCPISCGYCKSPIIPQPAPCTDRDLFCTQRARNGGCQRNPNIMKLHCRLTCGYCTMPEPIVIPNCVDTVRHCEKWAKAGYCRTHPEHMHRDCKRSCGWCGV